MVVPSPVGLFEVLVNWVEKSVAPDTIPAREEGTIVSRPLCAYPKTAKWTVSGSTDDASNCVCVDGQHQPGDFSVANPARD
jgi:feruloyl esterase